MADENIRFVRQRRNLILISLVVIFYKAGSLTVNKIDILGNSITVGNPEIVSFALATVFVYYAWRYYTVCREVLGFTNCKNAYYERLQKICRKNSIQQVLLSNPGMELNSCNVVGRQWDKITYSIGINKPHTYPGKEVKITVGTIPVYAARSVFYIIFHTSQFTEYLLPFLLAFLAVLELCSYPVTMNFIQLAVYMRQLFVSLIQLLVAP
jgi:hypothetical protein